MKDYYVDIQGHTAGPFSLDELRGLHAAGQITDETLFAQNGAVEWMPVQMIQGLFLKPDPVDPPPMRQPLIRQPYRPKAGRWDWVCALCGHVGRTRWITRGSLAVEIALWLCFLAPGFIYTIWRMTSRYRACPVCKSNEVFPARSPRGQTLTRPGLLVALLSLTTAAALSAGDASKASDYRIIGGILYNIQMSTNWVTIPSTNWLTFSYSMEVQDVIDEGVVVEVITRRDVYVPSGVGSLTEYVGSPVVHRRSYLVKNLPGKARLAIGHPVKELRVCRAGVFSYTGLEVEAFDYGLPNTQENRKTLK